MLLNQIDRFKIETEQMRTQLEELRTMAIASKQVEAEAKAALSSEREEAAAAAALAQRRQQQLEESVAEIHAALELETQRRLAAAEEADRRLQVHSKWRAAPIISETERIEKFSE